MKQMEIAGKQVWVCQTTERSEWVIIQPVDEHDMQGLDEEVAYLIEHTTNTFTLVAFRISNWNVELSPWAAPAVFGREDFGDGAAKTLCYVLDETHICFLTFAGFPANKVRGSTSLVTTEPAAMMAPSPIVTPGKTVE